MVGGLTAVLVACTLGLTLWSLVYVAINRVIDMPLFVGGMVLTVAMVLQLLVGVVGLLRTERPVSAPLFVGYLLVGVIVPPVGSFWATLEHSRWGPAVLAAAGLTTAVLVWRLYDIWSVHV